MLYYINMKVFLKIVFGCFSIYFFLWYLLYKTNINGLPIQSEDTVATIFTSVSIIRDGTLYLDNYYQMLIQRYPNPDDKSYEKGLIPFYLRKIVGTDGTHYISAFPIMTSIISLPVFYIPLSLFSMQVTWENLIILSHIASSLIMSFSVYFFYLLLKNRFLLSKKNTNLLTLIFAFGTINFALVSQAMWQYGTLQLFLILGLYFSYSKNLFLSGLFSGFSFITRPTSLLPILFNPFVGDIKNLNIYYTFNKKNIIYIFRRFSSFILGFLIPLVFFIWYNNAYYKDISNQGYADQLFEGWLSKFPEGFLGIWLSPSKGILVYSPIFVFSLMGLYISLKQLLSAYKGSVKVHVKDYIKNVGLNIQTVIFGIIVFGHIFVMGFWKHWYGGYSYGYRMASDIIPYLVLLLIPFVTSNYFNFDKNSSNGNNSSNKYQRIHIVFYILLFISILIQLHGMVFFDGIWHAAYDLGFKDTSWLWSISDSEFMFNIRRILVKLDMLAKACPKCL